LILLMISAVVLETCGELEYIYVWKEDCASGWLFTRTEPRCTKRTVLQVGYLQELNRDALRELCFKLVTYKNWTEMH